MINNDVAGTQRNDSPLHLATVLSGGRIRYAYMGGVGGRTRLRSRPRQRLPSPRGARTILVPDGRQRRGWRGLPRPEPTSTPRSGIIARGRTPCWSRLRREALPGAPTGAGAAVDQRVQPLRPGPGAEAGRSLGRVVVDLTPTPPRAFTPQVATATGAPDEQCQTTAAAQAIVDALSPLLPRPARRWSGRTPTPRTSMPNGLLLNRREVSPSGYGACPAGHHAVDRRQGCRQRTAVHHRDLATPTRG